MGFFEPLCAAPAKARPWENRPPLREANGPPAGTAAHFSAKRRTASRNRRAQAPSFRKSFAGAASSFHRLGALPFSLSYQGFTFTFGRRKAVSDRAFCCRFWSKHAAEENSAQKVLKPCEMLRERVHFRRMAPVRCFSRNQPMKCQTGFRLLKLDFCRDFSSLLFIAFYCVPLKQACSGISTSRPMSSRCPSKAALFMPAGADTVKTARMQRHFQDIF